MTRRRCHRTEAPPLVGWREWIGLPELGVGAIKAKMDTGARSSALHATEIRVGPGAGGDLVHFQLRPLQHDDRCVIRVAAPLLDWRQVRTSDGCVEERPIILTRLEMGGENWSAQVALTNRDTMGFRMLLGRQALGGRFLVDPSAAFLMGGGPDSGGV